MKDPIHCADEVTCLLLVVVKRRELSERDDGRKEATFSVRSETLAVEGKAKESVGGSASPGKDASKILTLWVAMMYLCCISVGGWLKK